MRYFAEIDADSTVLRLVVCDSVKWLEQNLGGTWIETDPNTRQGLAIKGGKALRGNYAGIGFKYDKELDAFIPPSNYESKVLNLETFTYEPPVKPPSDSRVAVRKNIDTANALSADGKNIPLGLNVNLATSVPYEWDEQSQSWIDQHE